MPDYYQTDDNRYFITEDKGHVRDIKTNIKYVLYPNEGILINNSYMYLHKVRTLTFRYRNIEIIYDMELMHDSEPINKVNISHLFPGLVIEKIRIHPKGDDLHWEFYIKFENCSELLLGYC